VKESLLTGTPATPSVVVIEPEDLGFERPEPKPEPEDDWQTPEDDRGQAKDGQSQGGVPGAGRVSLHIQVTGPRGERLTGVEVAVHWGPEGQDRLVAEPKMSDKEGMARFQVPRADYWVSARLGRVERRASVPRNWDPRRPIRIVLPAPGVDPDHFDDKEGTDGQGTPKASPKGQPVPLQIQVVGQRNQAIPGADVEIHWGPERPGSMRDRRKSGDNGIATFQLPRADYWIAVRFGNAQARGGVNHRWNPETPIIVRLAVSGDNNGASKGDVPKNKDVPRHVTLTIEVRGTQANRPVLGSAEVHVFGPRESRYTGRTDRYGRYSVQLPPGQYRIHVSKPGYHPGSDSAVVGTSDVKRVISLRGAIE
jgi:hypothetical protein